jgi:hypothetical protein
MNHKKIYTYMLAAAAVTAGVVYAATDRAEQPDLEKVKLPEGVAAQLAAQHSTPVDYPQLLLSGAADGVPYGLRSTDINDSIVSLAWNTPEALDGYFDDFEDHEEFAINSAGSVGWTYLDVDNRATYTWTACSYPNMGSKMAFIVMNPSKTTPSVADYPNYQPFSGGKMLVDFCAIDDVNNDYLISPELNFDRDFKVSFRCRSYSSSFNLERVRVGYSTTGKSPSDFTFVNEGPYVEVPAAWTLLEFEIPQEAKYVCVNCVSEDAFMFMLDDLFVGTNNIRPNAPAKRQGARQAAASSRNPLVGFNLYRDGVKVNEAPIEEVRYTDTVSDYRTYAYTVTALYADGSESAASEVLNVEVPDVHLLPFEDDFIKWTLAADKWSTPADADGDNRWKIDYYEYGLVDPAATYSYSALTNYDQSLVTAELHTTDIASTYLRLEVKLRHTRLVTTDYLSIEVTSDNGQTWQEVETLTNENGAFDWTVFQYPLGDLLTSKAFKVRFRAHGASAYYINYWYVDDIKIWNPEWTTAELAVATANGPLAACPVTLTADHGAVIRDTTDAQGLIRLPQVEVGKYAISITEDDYNVVDDTLQIVSGSANHFDIHVSQPTLALSTQQLSAQLAVEQRDTLSFSLSNTGDGPMTWRIPGRLTAGSGDASHRFDIQRSFDASGDLQSSIVFDGEYYYTTSSSYYYLGCFWKYDRDGNFIEQFSIPEMYYMMYDLTFDGRYVYGSDYSNRLFQLDFDNRRIVRTIEIADQSSLVITHCTYDPNRDGFWVGSWNSIMFINRDGVAQSLLTNISTTESLAIYGSAYDDVTPGGPYLWLSDETTANENTLDQIQLRQYSLTTRTLTGVTHVVSDVPGYKVGTSSYAVNNICGLYTTADLEDGSLTLIGMLAQSPAHIFAYKLCDAQSWLSYSPKVGTLQPGESQTISVALDARNGVVGEQYSADLTVKALPEIDEQSLHVSYTAARPSATPRPVALTAVADTAAVTLSWQAGSATTQPTGYRVYRDGTCIASVAADALSYVDTPALRGSYTYTVTALYGTDAQESVPSDAAETTVKIGAPYYAPLQLEATISRNSEVALQWLAPTLHVAEDATLAWTSGEHADELGLVDGGFFYVGTEWTADDLVDQRNKQVTSLSLRIVNQVTYFAAIIYKDGERIRQQANSNSIHYGEYNEIVLSQPVTIEPGSDYRFCFIVMHSADINPVALDGSSAVDGRGNLMSTDGKTWFTALEAGVDGNFNIRVNVQTTDAAQAEVQPVGYNVYRDGELVTDAPVVGYNYTDHVTTPGTHSYQVTSVYDANHESGLSASASVRVLNIGDRLAPQALNAQIERNRIVTLRWDYPTAETLPFPVDIASRPYTGAVSGPEFINAFMGSNTEVALASDGKSIYTSVYDEYNTDVAYINRYTMDGTYVESFVIDGLESVRGLAYDGTDFYASDYLNSIYRVDMARHEVLETIGISEYARHLCYVPDLNNGKGGFETGDWETSIYITRQGAKIGSGPTYAGAAGTAYYDGRLYAFEQGGTTKYDLNVYDFETGVKVDSIDLSQYVELSDLTTATAGGMSTFTTPEGHTFLLLCIQNTDHASQVAILDLSGVTGVAGYNVYCNGTQVNAELLPTRSFTETRSDEGDYRYQVQTVYIDGTTSPLSEAATVTVIPVGECDAPTDVKAVASTFGYNMLVSFADPDLTTAVAQFEGFESQTVGTAVTVASGVNVGDMWRATDALAYQGAKAIVADTTAAAYLILPVEEGRNWFSFIARNADDHNGTGSIDVLYSVDRSELADFYYLSSFSTTEAWTTCTTTLPAATRYVAIRKPANVAAQYVDALRMNDAEPTSTVYGYYVERNGVQLNTEPIRDIQYTDHNLESGHYEYRVRQITMTSGLSDWSEPVSVDLDYDNGSRAPEQLTASYEDDGIRLDWSAPSLGEPIYLRHHSGRSADAAGLPSGGAFYAGVRWNASDLVAYGALTVTDVQVYIHEIPDALFVLVYQGSTLMRQQYVPSLTQYSFNTIHLDQPLALDVTKELRIVVYVEHNEITVPLGYDEGPALYGKGDLYSTDGSSWETLTDNDIDGNWCISVGLSPFATTTAAAATSASADAQALPVAESARLNAFMGYNVYCNREQLNDTLVQATTWLDSRSHVSPYLEYQVSAVYAATGESYSPKVRLYTSDLEAAAWAGLDVRVSGQELRVYGAKSGTAVQLVAADGKVARQSVARDAYFVAVSTAQLPAGVYILRVGDRSVKVLVP